MEYERKVAEGGFAYVLAGDLVAQVRADQQDARNTLIAKALALDAVVDNLETGR
jgi:hypothetical protein